MRVRGQARMVVVWAAVAAVTGAGLLLLSQSDALTATGHRISALEVQRQRLLEQRSESLLALAAAGDPVARARRAEALGFAPPDLSEVLAVSGPLAAPVAAEQPLGIVHGERRAAAPTAETAGTLSRLAVTAGGGVARLGARRASAYEGR